MKKKGLVISIIVAQFILIVCLAIFALLKMVEGHKQMELADEYKKNARDQAVLLIQQREVYEQQLKDCQENNIK